MRENRLLLIDIVEAASAALRYAESLGDEQQFEDDDLRQDAILYRLQVVGEASSRLESAFREAWPDVPWREMIALRNLIVHNYAGLDLRIVWETLLRDVPEMLSQVRAILESTRDA